MKAQYNIKEIVSSPLIDAWIGFNTTCKTNLNDNVNSYIYITQKQVEGPIKNFKGLLKTSMKVIMEWMMIPFYE